MPKLHCKRVSFYSENDELSFFEWIGKIPSIEKWEGVSDTIVLHVRSKKISNAGLRDILALFHRYKINMTELKQFMDEKNKDWFFENEKAYWHKNVFKQT
ncbi:hypothetical protein QEH59_18340 [Coraliomargarita sp. SDUM461004]|uniref:Uncharacterized protein n=1 Tax=Thalassobacterium sedimentorum TaxID=3041258 RepID=A0ABU1ANR9_9BACT|nr:hypothetical protein [Coraliomargarita sp. SDUM461004]MDQ8196394.1 hypothetical protein [Coraliomargarita sp. SDUM461004]